MTCIHCVALLLWAYCSLWSPEWLGAPGEEADTWSVSLNLPLSGRYKPRRVDIKLCEIWKWGKYPSLNWWLLYSAGPFVRELSCLQVLMIKVNWQALLMLRLKPYFLGWKCVLTVLSWASTWPLTPDLQRLPWGKANSLPWIGKAPLRSHPMTWARADQCAREWAHSLHSFLVLCSNWGLSCQHSACHCCVIIPYSLPAH